ncbi:MAG: helix-turn-helix domain-containing protein, partial [Muribaculaceae bacterium]|nr:helix-turn-helix domain-containing protein [Muribaculaceae bacterium]
IDYNTHRLIKMVEMILENRAEPESQESEHDDDYDDASRNSVNQSSDKDEEPKSPGSKSRVLIVDDDPKMGSYLASQLEDCYYTEYVCNGNDAIRKLLSGSFNIVVADMDMPKMDGISLLSNIKGNSSIRDIPVILLSSKPGSDDRMKGLRKGSDGFLTKPFNIEELRILIHNRIRSVRSVKTKYTADRYIGEQMPQPAVAGNDEKLMKRITKSLSTHLSDPDFTIEMLSSEIGVSRSHLHRKMIDLTGMTTSEYIRNIRLKHAATLLRSGEMNISQVAYQCGFANPGHFATVFKKQFGQSPKEFVRNSAAENGGLPASM